ncbi:multi-sensor hybrid histidine kinase [Scytonema sp. HK-05]|uniref:hybrid sensor histidine kinase/response regulator n=1 Tax=Scytonema sp. HK-05 TaxID=1137095 RepID=UPI0009376F14|nr:response regulator [Scytonema sp. HK-05]OKH60026.1 hybrid sensor histidine kinase/response regulator [Scytonema sp. HK-05]BAY42717.1 multi-sensor hybrid histidine kinase [Scytonema sp. HK-05]
MSEPLVTILHVDDNETNRYVVARVLRSAGFAVMEATTGEAGLQAIAQAEPGLVILDVQLPDTNGFEVCRQIKSNSATANLPVLHLSAHFTESRDKAQGLDSGADAYLAQPVEPIELIATVKALLRMRRAEELASAMAREWQTTFDSISDGVGLLDKEGKFLRCNKAMTKLLNKPSSEIIGRRHQDMMQMALGCDVTPFLRVQESRHRQSLVIHTLGRWFSVTVDPALDEFGKFTGAVYNLADITVQRQAEIALRSSEERFRLLLENVKDYAIFFLDSQGRINGWSLGAEYILGYQEAEILGQPSGIIFIPEDLQQGEDKKELEKAVAEGRAENERWHLRKDGSRFWASGIATRLIDEAGQLRGFCKIMRDLTERKRAEDERAQLLEREQEARSAAEAANRMKDEFLATLSHELRSPLNAMLGWTRLLNTRKFDEATTARAMETIERSAKSQAQLVEDLLDVSRIIQGKLRLNVRPIGLVSVIEAALETVRPAADAKEIQLQSALDRTAGPVAGDSDRLQQVVWNLLSNAIKFTPKGGLVQILLECVNSYVEITVTDTGKGISREFVPYVFERFRQADSSTTRTYSGLGLGLAIVRHLVELHGGTVHAESQGEGKGATFKVRLPLVKESRTREQQAKKENMAPVLLCTSTPLPILDGLQILVVDDEADTREFLVAAVEMCGAEVIAVSSAIEAIEVISQHRFDVLVSDVGMPEEDGYSLIRKVRKLPKEQGGDIPAVALTAYAREEDRMRSLSQGFQMHLSKPVEPDKLATMIASLVKKTAKS